MILLSVSFISYSYPLPPWSTDLIPCLLDLLILFTASLMSWSYPLPPWFPDLILCLFDLLILSSASLIYWYHPPYLISWYYALPSWFTDIIPCLLNLQICPPAPFFSPVSCRCQSGQISVPPPSPWPQTWSPPQECLRQGSGPVTTSSRIKIILSGNQERQKTNDVLSCDPHHSCPTCSLSFLASSWFFFCSSWLNLFRC